MVARVDPKSDRLALTSFPRDLMVTIADTGEIGMINSAYSRPKEGEGEQNLINTLRQNFGMPVHHFVEVNFESFKRVVDAVGGVSDLVPDGGARQVGSGLYVDKPGCLPLDGDGAGLRPIPQAPDHDAGWLGAGPASDLSRVQRQQIFIHRALDQGPAAGRGPTRSGCTDLVEHRRRQRALRQRASGSAT